MFHLSNFNFTSNFLFHSLQNSDSVSKKQKIPCWTILFKSKRAIAVLYCVVTVKEFMKFSLCHSITKVMCYKSFLE
eukprot:TRINITY_DN3312_c1_g1_i17.p1 TRINITY_DN3312_c1_g1~~TRINITY_DN3312_c1_g1_i17.p1  ORF type:complete len:76 (+),score=5.81 TRINITY_DN3312_c1_g1_i17:97-324(+)